MKPAEIEVFGKLWAANVQALGGTRPVGDAVTLLFGDLVDFELEEIREALAAHRRRRSEYIPRPFDVIRLIEGVVPEPEVLVAVAHAGRHPIALPVRAVLGVDLQGLHPRALEARIRAHADRIGEFHDRATRGAYAEDEIARMLAADIDPEGAIGPEMPPPRMSFRAALAERVAAIRERRALAAPSDGPRSMLDDSHRTPAAVAARDAAFARMGRDGAIEDVAGTLERSSEKAAEMTARTHDVELMRRTGMADGATANAIDYAKRSIEAMQRGEKLHDPAAEARRIASVRAAQEEASR